VEAAREKAERKKEAIRKKAEEKERAQSKNQTTDTIKTLKFLVKRVRLFCGGFVDAWSFCTVPLDTDQEQSQDHDAMPLWSDDLDSNQCSVCFEFYDQDRWLHEDCYSEIVVDKYGRELLCPFCVP